MSRPLLLDLFCGAGGAAMGYSRAGFDVVGVDIKPQPHYPFRFIQADAMTYPLDGFDAIHASPPCQVFTRARHLRTAQNKATQALDLVDPIRQRLTPLAIPWVIENVEGSPVSGALLCGSDFRLAVRRHRIFESNVLLFGGQCRHREQGRPVGVYHRLNDEAPHGGRTARTLQEAQDAMGIDWMTFRELKEAVPPAYTEYVGTQLLTSLEFAA